MRYYLDEEFIDDGQTIDLISIGIVAEDGRELYLQSCEFDPDKASSWVQEHVFTSLVVCPCLSGNVRGLYAHEEGQCIFNDTSKGIIGAIVDCPWRTREQLKRDILCFMDPLLYGKPELWSWCGAYDFVAFCQIFGTMMDLPPSYPHYIKDLQQVLDERGISDEELPEQEEGLHHALQDARHLKRLWGYIVRNDCWQ